MRAKISGKPWEIVFTNRLPEDRDGDCSHPLQTPRKIRVRKGLPEERELEIIIHEYLHAKLWFMDEAVVDEAGKELQRILTERGYRR